MPNSCHYCGKHVSDTAVWPFEKKLFCYLYKFNVLKSLLPDICISRRSLTHPLFIQLQQSVPDLGGVGGQAKAVQVELRHDELQQPLGRQAPRGGVTGGRRHRLLQDGTSQRLHLRKPLAVISSRQINFTHTDAEGEKSTSVPLWCERWFCSCTELHWILLSPPDGSWWLLDRGDRPCRRNFGALRRQHSHINTTVKNNNVRVKAHKRLYKHYQVG